MAPEAAGLSLDVKAERDDGGLGADAEEMVVVRKIVQPVSFSRDDRVVHRDPTPGSTG